MTGSPIVAGASLIAGLALLCTPAPCHAKPRTWVVGVDAPSVQQTVELAATGDIVEVPSGSWSGPVRIEKAVTLRGKGGVLEGGGEGTAIRVEAAGAVVEDLRVNDSGQNVSAPDCCIYVAKTATGAVIRNNVLTRCGFGIWVHETDAAQVIENTVTGRVDLRVTDRGNGIHLFNASHLVVRDNEVSEARDGIYVSATEDSLIEGNHSHDLRFGVHYMFSYRNTVRGNRSVDNVIGLALMESRHLTVTDNEALRNERDGLLFRDVQYTTIRRNRLQYNGHGMFFFSSTENVIEDNLIAHNEVGLKVWAGTMRNRIVGNRIVGNRQQVFFVSATDQIWGADGKGNIWGDYVGWDQNGDGIGDRPHRVDSFRAKLLYVYPAAVLLLRSPALEMLAHVATRMPFLRVPTVIDPTPMLEALP